MSLHDLLLGELKAFRKYAEIQIKEIKEDQAEFQKVINKKVESFSQFKWKLTGAAALAAFLATIVIELVKR